MFRLSVTQKASLISQPETGMGFQTVEATTFDNQTKRGTALNAELLVFENERMDLRTASVRKLVETAPSAAGEIRTLTVVRRTLSARMQESLRLSDSVKANVDKAKPAKDAPEEKRSKATYSSDSRRLRTTTVCCPMEVGVRERMRRPRTTQRT
jgi:hypothetical protein